MARLDTVDAVARRLHADTDTVRRWCRQGKVRAFRLPSGEWRVWIDGETRVPIILSTGNKNRRRDAAGRFLRTARNEVKRR